jgi:radical SAM family uncharacterized protein/radical SAM-linked protein
LTSLGEEGFARIIESVNRPSSYIGAEVNSVRKDRSSISASIALAFPDLYDLGMSHAGLKILYHVINAAPDFAAERVFAPDEDFARELAREGLPLCSLETKTPLAQFDVVGFTIPYELSYTNILWMLDLSGIPLRSADRGDLDTFVVGGGAGVYNPEPIADFFDFFFMGDGERGALEIMRAVAETKGYPRAGRLKRFAQIPGVYVPSFFSPGYGSDGRIEKIAPLVEGYEKVTRVFLPTLSESPHPFDAPPPFGKPIHDRLNVEIDRGCTQGCRFCQAGTTYRPARERTPDEVAAIMDAALEQTGYDEASLTSLSAGDYSRIEVLLTRLMDKYEESRVSLSLPSLRSSTVTDGMITQIGRVGKSGFTITAEAGSQRLRDVLNKKVAEEDILRVATRLLEGGWQSLKLYFMIGLPTETDEDVEGIFTLSDRLANLSAGRKTFRNINVSVSNFVPKPHTAFQWYGQEATESLKAKKDRLFALIKKNRRLTLKWHDSRMSHMEAAFSRGDRRLGAVVEAAYRMGQRMDAWTERFKFDVWTKAFAECGLDSRDYANRTFGLDDTLPWDRIDTGLSKRFFRKEWENALEGVVTDDCKTGKCLACGIDPKTCFSPYEADYQPAEKPPTVQTQAVAVYRLYFRKTGLCRFLSHLELRNVLIRAIRRSGVALKYSEGFTPHPKITFGPALKLGVESMEEIIDVSLCGAVNTAELLRRLNSALPEGISFSSAEPLAPGAKGLSSLIEGFEYDVAFSGDFDPSALKEAVGKFNAAPSVIFRKEKGGAVKETELKSVVSPIEFDAEAGAMRMKVKFDQVKGSVQAHDVVSAMFPGGAPLFRVVKLRNITQWA